MPHLWDITSFTVKDNVTTIGAVPRDRSRQCVLISTLTRMTLDELSESHSCMKEHHHRWFLSDMPCSEGDSVSVYNYENCYVINVCMYDVEETAKEYIYASERKLGDKWITHLKEVAETAASNFAAWSNAPHVKAEESAYKNIVCDKDYFGLPRSVYAHWYGQISI